MASSLKSRLDRITRGIGPAAGKLVIIWPDAGDAPPIEWTGPGGADLSLRAPDGDGDPIGRLSEEQRAMIGPDDRLIVVQYIDEGPADA
jgi:hypothetical protein